MPLPPRTISERLAWGHMSTSTTGILRSLAISVASTKDKNVFPTPPLLLYMAYRMNRLPRTGAFMLILYPFSPINAARPCFLHLRVGPKSVLVLSAPPDPFPCGGRKGG